MMGSKDREGLKPHCCQVFPQSAVGFWVIALGAKRGETMGGVTPRNQSKGAMKQVGAEHRLGECTSSVKH